MKVNSKVVKFGDPTSSVEVMDIAETNIPTDGTLEEQIIQAIQTVYDPEISVNIYDLGLIYKIDIKENKDVAIDMTLTAPGCPVAGQLVAQVEQATASVAEINNVKVELVWDPPWTQECMSDAAKLDLGFF